jgi:hypothetical protein
MPKNLLEAVNALLAARQNDMLTSAEYLRASASVLNPRCGSRPSA